MANSRFQPKSRIVRSAVKEDLLYFAIPALLVFTLGLVISFMVGPGSLMARLWELVNRPGELYSLSWQNIFGLVLFVVGLTIAIIAVATLREFYHSTLVIREDHQLVTHGIYRYIRHPVYLGVLIAIIGIPVYNSSLYGLLVMSALVPFVLNRIRIEERLLSEEFGDAYRDYQERTSKLVPFIY